MSLKVMGAAIGVETERRRHGFLKGGGGGRGEPRVAISEVCVVWF